MCRFRRLWVVCHPTFQFWVDFQTRARFKVKRWTFTQGRFSNTLLKGSACYVCCPDENRQHLLTTCVFACQFWFQVHSPFGLQDCVPHCNSPSFAEWWPKTIKSVPFGLQVETEGLNSLIILAAWMLWKHTNSVSLMVKIQTSPPSTKHSKKSIICGV